MGCAGSARSSPHCFDLHRGGDQLLQPVDVARRARRGGCACPDPAAARRRAHPARPRGRAAAGLGRRAPRSTRCCQPDPQRGSTRCATGGQLTVRTRFLARGGRDRDRHRRHRAGIPENLLPQIFDPFFTGVTAPGPGSGCSSPTGWCGSTAAGCRSTRSPAAERPSASSPGAGRGGGRRARPVDRAAARRPSP